jgi:hypothetical protein
MSKLVMMDRPSLRGTLLAAYSVGDLLATLKKVEKPSEPLAGIVSRVEKLVAKYEEGEGGYGRILDVATLTRIRKELAGVPEKDDATVKRALRILGALLGEEEVSFPGESEMKGTRLEGYGTAEVQASVPGRPGWYRARLVKAGPSLNGLKWRDEVLQGAVTSGFFENVPLNVFTWTDNFGVREDHLENGSPYRGFAVGNQIGFARNATWDAIERAVYGDVFISDASRRTLVDEVLNSGGTAGLGLSIVADGDTTISDEVERLYGVKAFDMVTYPAAEGQIVGTLVVASVGRWAKESRVTKEVVGATEEPIQPEAVAAPEPVKDDGASVQAVIERVDGLQKEFGQAESEKNVEKMEELARQAMEVIRGLPDLGFECWRAGANVPGTVLDLVNRAWEAKAQAATVTGEGEVEQVQQTLEGGTEVSNEVMGVLAAIQKQLGDQAKGMKELRASVDAVQRRDALSDVERLVEQRLTAGGIVDPTTRHAVRELTAGKVLDVATVDGLVGFTKKLQTSAGVAMDRQVTSVSELQGGVSPEGQGKLRKAVASFLFGTPAVEGGAQ